MNEEIKEILDMLKDSVDNPILESVDEFAEETYEYPNHFVLDPTTKDCKLLLDYITNLQQRLEDETLCKEIAQGHRDEVIDRESRELEELKDYKSRNEKAIEYIKEHLEREYFDYDILEANTIYNRDLYKVLQILDKVGSDKE